MRRILFSLLISMGGVIFAEDIGKNGSDSEINFNDPSWIEKVNENMHFSNAKEFKNMSPDAQQRAQQVMLGGND